MDEPTTCTNCKSKRLVSIRKDADWGTGGDLYRLNDEKYYESSDPSSMDEFDIEYFHCLGCGSNEPLAAAQKEVE